MNFNVYFGVNSRWFSDSEIDETMFPLKLGNISYEMCHPSIHLFAC